MAKELELESSLLARRSNLKSAGAAIDIFLCRRDTKKLENRIENDDTAMTTVDDDALLFQARPGDTLWCLFRGRE